jgi:hypothetical protein
MKRHALSASFIVQLPAIHGARAALSGSSVQMQSKSVRLHVELLIAEMRHESCGCQYRYRVHVPRLWGKG